MTESEYASHQLRVIRALMERATIYRSISAATALAGGLLSLCGFATAYYAEHVHGVPLDPIQFLIVWLVILVLTSLTNLFFLARGAAHRREPFFSSGMKCTILSLAPAFSAAALLTFTMHGSPIRLAMMWISLYGLGLLATQHFAPRSLILLGLAFFLTGCTLLATWKHLFIPSSGQTEPSALVVSGLMAATFGGYHLAYAVAVWALGEERAPQPGTENV